MNVTDWPKECEERKDGLALTEWTNGAIGAHERC